MLRAGIPMGDIDETDLALYLKVMAYAAEHDGEKKGKGKREQGTGKPVVELRRGFIDEFL